MALKQVTSDALLIFRIASTAVALKLRESFPGKSHTPLEETWEPARRYLHESREGSRTYI